MTGGELHILLARVADPATPEERDAAWNAIADEFAAMTGQIKRLHRKALKEAEG